jgi:hypothetical protein
MATSYRSGSKAIRRGQSRPIRVRVIPVGPGVVAASTGHCPLVGIYADQVTSGSSL